MTNKTILVIEDEISIRDMLRFIFTTNGFNVVEAEDTEGAYKEIAKKTPDIIILDWMLPKMSGIEIAKRLKNDLATKEIPLIMLTARAEEDNKVEALSVGADDYVVKPFSPRELIARIHAVLRRGSNSKIEEDDVLQFNGLVLDMRQYRASILGEAIELRPLEFRLLHFFMTHIDRTYTRSQLLDYVWGQDAYVDERTIDVAIRRLRNALRVGGYDKFIQTVRGTGYRFSST